jgi:hypothetical protein
VIQAVDSSLAASAFAWGMCQPRARQQGSMSLPRGKWGKVPANASTGRSTRGRDSPHASINSAAGPPAHLRCCCGMIGAAISAPTDSPFFAALLRNLMKWDAPVDVCVESVSRGAVANK